MSHEKPMNILYVHANNTDIGGADYCLFKLASELDRERFRPVVILARETEIMKLYREAGIKTHVIAMERIKKSSNPVYLAKLFIRFFFTVHRIRRIIRDERIDLVHGNDLLDIYGPVAARFEKKPAVQYVRWIMESPAWLKAAITRIVYFLNDRIMTVSNGVSTQMFSREGKVLPRTVTCYDWIDMEKVGHGGGGGNIREEFDIPPEASLVGCVGRLEGWKGQDVFIRAAAEVLKTCPDTRFLVVGGSVEGRGRESFSDQLKKLVAMLGIENRVIFTGHRSDIGNIMGSLDVFVHSSTSPDPLPGVVMEAMYNKTPVVGADAGGVPEEVENHRTGLLYPPGDHERMAEKIVFLLSNRKQAVQMGIDGKLRVATVFNKKKLCRKIESIYIDMAADKQAAL